LIIFYLILRFGRFAKEFGIVASPPLSSQKSAPVHSPPYIVSGEVDIVFMNTVKMSTDSERIAQLPSQPTKAFVVQKKSGLNSAKSHSSGTANTTTAAAQSLSPAQFVVAVEQLACRVYAQLIEEQTGTTLECLPPKQRESAARAAQEVLLKKKIIPVADKLGM
jgi:hypothetical protein